MHQNLWQQLKKPIFGLAPMDGITDSAFRQMIIKYSSPKPNISTYQKDLIEGKKFLPTVMFTEFTTVEGLAHGASKPLLPFYFDKIEHPIIAQIFGTDPKAFYQACFIIAELGFDGIDINMGCPSKSVSNHGAGAGLIRNPKLAQEILRTCKCAAADIASGKNAAKAGVHPDIVNWLEKRKPQINKNPAKNIKCKTLPISVKTRIGYDKIITKEWIKNLLAAEPDCITLHGRTLNQMYAGKANWEEIGKAAQIIKAERPETIFLGNGDIENIGAARKKTEEYELDGVLVGRATFGNPWFFCGQLPSPHEKLSAAAEHARLYETIFGGGPKVFAPMKKHLGWYCKGFKGAKELRLKLMAANSATEVENLIKNHISLK